MSCKQIYNTSGGSLVSGRYLVISLLLSLLGMGAVFYFTYSPGLFAHLSFKRMPGLVIAFAVAMLRVWFVASKIRYLAEGSLSWNASLRIALVWDFASAVTPSTIGGTPVATYAMTKEGIALGKSTAISLYGVMLDQFWYAIAVPVLLISGVWLEVIPPEIGFVGAVAIILVYAGLLAFGALLAYGLMVRPTAIGGLVRVLFRLPFLRRYRERASKEAESLEGYSKELKRKPARFILKAFYLSTIAWLCRVAIPVIVVLSLLPANEILLVLRSLAMNIASLVIPTPGGSGGVEGLFALFMGPLIARESFIGLALFLWRFITYYISIGIGIFATTWYVNNSVEEILDPSDPDHHVSKGEEKELHGEEQNSI